MSVKITHDTRRKFTGSAVSRHREEEGGRKHEHDLGGELLSWRYFRDLSLPILPFHKVYKTRSLLRGGWDTTLVDSIGSGTFSFKWKKQEEKEKKNPTDQFQLFHKQ